MKPIKVVRTVTKDLSKRGVIVIESRRQLRRKWLRGERQAGGLRCLFQLAVIAFYKHFNE